MAVWSGPTRNNLSELGEMRWTNAILSFVIGAFVLNGSLSADTVESKLTDTVIPWLNQLDQLLPDNALLTEAVRKVIPVASPAGNPDLALITYHVRNEKIQDVVVQIFQSGRPDNAAPLINPHGVVRERVGESFGDASEKFLGLMLQPGRYFGDPAEVSRQQRAFSQSASGDLSLLREQTIDPLHVVAILPQPGRYLPTSLSAHVQSAVFTAQLGFGEWRGKLNLIADDPDNAEQVGNVVAGWRDMAGSLANAFGSYGSGQRLKDALKETTVQVSESRVTASGVVPAAVIVRAVKEMAGHGGGCPPGGVCGRDQVAVCHNGQTECVPTSQVAAYLAQGDHCGPCLAEELASQPVQPVESKTGSGRE